jgi:Crp-like helix-turn-helix domain
MGGEATPSRAVVQIANMLGVRREGVTEGALKLQRAGLISYTRGHITVLDRAQLESAAANATPWLNKSTTACCPFPQRFDQNAVIASGRPMVRAAAYSRRACDLNADDS